MGHATEMCIAMDADYSLLNYFSLFKYIIIVDITQGLPCVSTLEQKNIWHLHQLLLQEINQRLFPLTIS